MSIVIVGAGEVGFYLSQALSNTGKDVTVIESDEGIAHRLQDELNVRVLSGNGSSAHMLERAGVSHCRHFLSVTSDDQTNLVACSLAKAMGGKKIHTLARIHDSTYSDTTIFNYQSHFGIDFLFNPEALCAVELAKSIRNPGRVAVENFARGQIEVQTLFLSKRSSFVGKSLFEIKLDRRIRVGYIIRKGQTILPRAETVFEAGDSVVLFGETNSLYEQRGKFDPDQKIETTKVVIFGATEIAIALIRMLNNPRFKIRVIEQDKANCARLADQFSHITVIQGDARTTRLLEEEQVGHADYFIGCTRRDEDNVMACLQGKKLGVEHTLVVINKPDYEGILNELREPLGIDNIVSPRTATGNEILRLLSDAPYSQLAAIPNSDGVIVEVVIPAEAKLSETTIRELTLPKGTLLVAILRHFEVKVPGADDILQPSDRVVFICPSDTVKESVKVLTANKPGI